MVVFVGEAMMKTRHVSFFAAIAGVFLPGLAGAELERNRVEAALQKAIEFYWKEVSVGGAYVYRYSADLAKAEGEGKVGRTSGWTQPPGTPTVGEAYVDVYELTGSPHALAAARQSAEALVRTQLHSGGWYSRIEILGPDRKRYAYRVDGKASRKARNTTTLDDNKTQSCIRFLMRLDRALEFKDEEVHAVATSSLRSLLDAQFANGGWPHAYSGPALKKPVQRANFPEKGKETRIKNYWELYTLNDNLMSDVVDVLFLAEEVYGGEKGALGELGKRSRQAAEKAGDFLILAQLPDPQPGWAQQYDFEMRPAWARKFEPAAITGGESQAVMDTLLKMYERTGEKKYLKPLPRALAYYRSSQLPNGKLARFYEMRTNKPLYFTKDYKLTYDDGDVPTHYSFQVSSRLDRIEKRFRELAGREWRPPVKKEPARPSEDVIRALLKGQDERGAWVEEGRLRYWGKGDDTTRVIEGRTFVSNLRLLARWLKED